MSYKLAFIGIGVVVLAQIVALVFGLYGLFPNFDIPMHFGGGFVMGILGIAIHHQMASPSHNRLHHLHHVLFVLGFTMLIAVAWEFHEYIIDETIGKWNGWGKTQLSLGDTMLDLLLGGVGSLTAFSVFRKQV